MALWIAVPVQEKWIKSLERDRGRELRRLRPVHPGHRGRTTARSSSPEPELVGRRQADLTEIDMSMTTEPAQGQAAYEAGELDMVLTPSRGHPARQGAIRSSGRRSSTSRSSRSPHYTYNNKTGPTANKDFRIALTQAIDKKAFIDADVRRHRPIRPTASGCRASRLPGRPRSVSVRPGFGQGAHGYGPAALGVQDAAALGKLKFGFNSGAGHEPRVAFLAEAWRQAFGLETEQIGSDFCRLPPAADGR